MRWRRLLFLMFAYVVVDLADPFPGAFEFSAEESVEAIHAAGPRASTRGTGERTDPATSLRRAGELAGAARGFTRARRPSTDWLALSRPAHAARPDPVVPAPSEDH